MCECATDYVFELRASIHIHRMNKGYPRPLWRQPSDWLRENTALPLAIRYAFRILIGYLYDNLKTNQSSRFALATNHNLELDYAGNIRYSRGTSKHISLFLRPIKTRESSR